MANLVQVSHDPDIKRLGHDLMTLRSQLARQVRLPDAHEARNTLPRLIEALERQEMALAQKSREYKRHLQVTGTRLEQIQARLPSGSALLEFRSTAR